MGKVRGPISTALADPIPSTRFGLWTQPSSPLERNKALLCAVGPELPASGRKSGELKQTSSLRCVLQVRRHAGDGSEPDMVFCLAYNLRVDL